MSCQPVRLSGTRTARIVDKPPALPGEWRAAFGEYTLAPEFP